MAIGIGYILNPSDGLTLGTIILVSFILGLLHGATPDEHTWPITFSYAIGSYSTRKGMKAGFIFSGGFTIQRAFLTTLGFLGLAALYRKYNLDGPIYVIVGIAMLVAGMYILNKKKYLHIAFDSLFRNGTHRHHSEYAKRQKPDENFKEVPPHVALVHGLIAGFGFGAYASIITFILAPQVPGLIYAPLPGLFFGLGTMAMQIIFGAVFANLAKAKKLSENDIKYVGRKTAGRTLYYGGIFFALIGILIVLFPALDSVAIGTGISIPNLDVIGISTILVLVVVGIIGIGSLVSGLLYVSELKGKGNIEENSETKRQKRKH